MSCYASYYNQRYGYHGHVFEGRFKSCIVKDDSYFLQTSRYIHMNPVKAKITAHPEDYPWSSYRTILRMTDDRITQPEKTLAFFKQSIFYYREFVEDATHKYSLCGFSYGRTFTCVRLMLLIMILCVINI